MNTKYERDAEGYLVQTGDWDEEIAVKIAGIKNHGRGAPASIRT